MYPEVVHRLNGEFGVVWTVSLQLYIDENFDWRKLDVIHLLVNHRRYCRLLKNMMRLSLALSTTVESQQIKHFCLFRNFSGPQFQ